MATGNRPRTALFFIVLFLLLLIGGTIFYFGWIQIHLGPDLYAVAFTKTGGWDETVMVPGKFLWRWERLIPTNMTLYKFPLKPVATRIQTQGSLPSADIYSTLLDNPTGFSYSLELSVTFTLKPDNLPLLVSKDSLTPDKLDAWYEDIKASLTNTITQDVIKLLNASPSSILTINRSIENLVIKAFPYLDFSEVLVLDLKIPDLCLYEKTREKYFEVLEAKSAALIKSLEAAVEKQSQEASRFELLSKYGQLLTEYPILLEYLSLESKLSAEQ